jgi:hypothetical protein
LDEKPLNEASFVLPANEGPALPEPGPLKMAPNSAQPLKKKP